MEPTSNYEPGLVYGLLNAVMSDVGAVGKNERNTAQNFSFRGIDSVVNAVYPALVKHGLVIVPSVMEHEYETVTVGKNATPMGRVSMLVSYTVWASDGSHVHGEVRAEAMDSGDKATAKCMSVAYRTFLLQTFCLPTDEIDPDAESYERHASSVTRPKRPVSEPAAQPANNAAGLTKAQQTWVSKQTLDDMTKVSDILGRVVSSLSDVNSDEARVLIQQLAKKDGE
jgi:hypothetical protein